ncbi:MAG: hypothetical protein JJ884_03735 [Maricaulis sp.]|jgi:hypothetical protein|uniref:hypothetical protein n=1 Tax=Maricaulis sp. TaxID=1486257 RepID=UPI001B2A85A4|nr:hypothetical protein [Maricaulis sp.]MBO6846610.1 hypothetical protein [Maricaulis sp.]MBO6877153.1 hypothetical protein [Maricaulis sp.]
MSTVSAFFNFQLWSLRATWPPLVLLFGALLVALVSPFAWLSVLAGLGVLVLALDSFARLREFVRLRGVFQRIGAIEGRALAEFRRSRTSWCSRRAAIAAAYAAGLGLQARQMVRGWGYRPWHILPDRAFSLRSPFLRVNFWKSVLGITAK